MSDNKDNKYILVLGNGFDLGCGLRCSYHDFFLFLKNNDFLTEVDGFTNSVFQEPDKNSLQDMTTHEVFSVWEYYFVLKYKEGNDIDKLGWFDIENEIKKSLEPNGFWDGVYDYLINNWSQSVRDAYCDTINTDSHFIIAYMLYIRYRFSLLLSVDRNVTLKKKDFYAALLQELNHFEKKFGDYMKDLLGEDYRIIRDRHLDIIFSLLGNEADTKILSFNYSSLATKNSKYQIEYVHGTTENPIFGITTDKDDAYSMFDKITRRRNINAKLKTYESILKKKEEGNHYNLVFFGLSFADADFDDYKKIFEYLGEHDKIYVLYPDYGHEKRKQEVHDNFMNLYQEIYDPEKNEKQSSLEEGASLEFFPVVF